MLSRKHEWESTTKKASNRSWEKVYAVLSGETLAFFKDQKIAKTDPKVYHKHETPIELQGSTASAATDYSKRPNVFRLKLPSGAEFLFQCKDDAEKNEWINRINSASGVTSERVAMTTRSQTMPATVESEARREEPKKRAGIFGKKK
jgi:spectrin beta